MRVLLAVALVGLVSACAQPMIWDKPGANQADFNKDDYNCRKDAIAAGGTTYVGFGVTNRNADVSMYQRCMVASGWSLRQEKGQTQAIQTNSNSEGTAAMQALRDRQQKVCADPKYAPYYSKSPCLANQMNFEQLADQTKISPAAKAIFVELRNTVDAANQEGSDIFRKYGGAKGAKAADYYTTIQKAQNDQNNLALYNGQITWGEYNKRRQQIYTDSIEATK